ncbi:hypothetical protein RB614_02220 [Phytohabitans sp. ZYX-F-186]|uniref:Roadblock/LAMTOR2 domain-containing protein n=1 Tax=Phytohabitans maris TaxID=3071409 RepID=A0ABU0Z8E4_9ACTN|nr:hypothetical protein [Phytohabitans sp. ZYX-F-186]MDQ7903334.1 hypothetical protein [Phytohabitans sp. ZYX-F-186]
MSIEDVIWGDALRITGARAVIVTAIDTRKPLRTATIEAFPDGESIAEMAAAMAETAVELVRLTDADTAMDDLLVTSHRWFHVLRIVDGEGPGGCVAHLLLDRRQANLAMARREFRELTVGVEPAGGPVPQAAAPAVELAGALPRRTPSATGPWDRGTSGEDPAAAWFGGFDGHPFAADGRTVERVRDGLHRLG